MRSERFPTPFSIPVAMAQCGIWSRTPRVDRADRVVPNFRQAGGRRLPRAGGTLPSCVSGRPLVKRQACNRVHQHGGRRGPAHQCRAVSGRGRAEATRRSLREGSELAEFRHYRRPPHHRPKPLVLDRWSLALLKLLRRNTDRGRWPERGLIVLPVDSRTPTRQMVRSIGCRLLEARTLAFTRIHLADRAGRGAAVDRRRGRGISVVAIVRRGSDRDRPSRETRLVWGPTETCRLHHSSFKGGHLADSYHSGHPRRFRPRPQFHHGLRRRRR